MQFGINKHKEYFSKTNKSVQDRRASVHFVVFEKFTSVLYLFQILHEKNHVITYICINNIHKKHNYNDKFWQRTIF